MFKYTRCVALALGVLSFIIAFGGLSLGLLARHGQFVALGCLGAGVALSCSLWLAMPLRSEPASPSLLFSFSLASGMALYTNLAWALWALGIPVSLGTVADGRMGEHYWLGPLTLVYAVSCYAAIKFTAKKGRQPDTDV